MKKPQRSLFRRISEFLHLWLGLGTGLVVMVVCFTAAIWVFRDEINYLTMPENRVAVQDQPYWMPSQLITKGKEYLRTQGKDTSGITVEILSYRKPGRATQLLFKLGKDKFENILIDPYDGRITYESPGESRTDKFLNFVRAGHRFFWMGHKIGSPFVGSCCLCFLIILITGLIWWYPKKWNASTRKKSFTIKWGANWKRVNIDLHNVLGFYAFIVCILLSTTGVTFTFTWFNKAWQKTLTGKATGNDREKLRSTPEITRTDGMPADKLWDHYSSFIKEGNEVVTLVFPDDSLDTWRVMIFPTQGRIANRSDYFHDQYSLKLLKKTADYQTLSAGEKFYKNTFDIHVATIFGLPSKIIAALASLTGASLPVTGFIIWYNRKFGKKKKRQMQPDIA